MKVMHLWVMLVILYVLYMCGYCKTIEDYILECQSAMKVLLFYMMLVLMYMLYCVDIAKQ